MFGIFNILGFLGRIFGGGGGGILDRILSSIDNRVDSDVEREKLKAEVTMKYLQAQVDSSLVRKDAFGPWAWMMAAVFLPGPVLWWNMVFFDSVFGWEAYDVLALPVEFYPWMTSIIGALFFIPTVNKMFTK